MQVRAKVAAATAAAMVVAGVGISSASAHDNHGAKVSAVAQDNDKKNGGNGNGNRNGGEALEAVATGESEDPEGVEVSGVEVPTLDEFRDLEARVSALEERLDADPPADPEDPEEPEEPEEPADPEDPEDPAEPDEPDEPEEPADPDPEVEHNDDGVALTAFDTDVDDDTLTVSYTLSTDREVTFDEVAVAVRDAQGANLDFGHEYDLTVDGTAEVTASAEFAAGDLEVWVAYTISDWVWVDLGDRATVTIEGDDPVEPVEPDEPVNGDNGNGTGEVPAPPVAGSWDLAFEDTFDGNSVDGSKWTHRSSSQSHNMQGNKPNGQLSWNQLENCTVDGGTLTQHAKRERVTQGGQTYDWTACLLTTVDQLTVGNGLYIEERSTQPPANSGMWPAFWTWQGPGVNSQQEIDVYEYWPSWPGRANMWSNGTHGAMGSSGAWHNYSDYDTTPQEFNRYGAHITGDGVDFYLNGEHVNHNPRTITGTNIPIDLITNMFVWADEPPDSDSDGETREVDYVAAWTRG